MRRLLALGLSAALTLSSAPAFADSAPLKIEKILRPSANAAPIEVLAGQVLVKFSAAATPAQMTAAVAAVSGVVQRQLLGWTIVNLPAGASVVPALSTLRAMPGVDDAEPNHIFRPVAVPNDPQTTSQYALQQVNAFSAWEYERGFSNKTTVVVIDSGIDGSHPDLSPKLTWVNSTGGAINHKTVDNTTGALSNDNANGAGLPSADCVHGTQVASVAAAATDNSLGVAGMSWGAQLLSLKVFNQGCGGATADCACSTTDTAIAAALDYVRTTVAPNAAAGKVVVNMSLGGAGACGTNPLTKTALTNLVAAGVPVTIASGNAPFCSDPTADGTGVDSPANCAGVSAAAGIIPVGATNSANSVTSYSCAGPELASHGLVAPGDGVLVDTPGGGTTSDSGTSFASPYAAGLIALMLSAKPALTPTTVESYLRGGADSIGGASLAGAQPSGNSSGAGRMDAFRTMRLTENGTLANYDGDQKAIAFPNPFRMSVQRSVAFSIPVSLQGSNPEIKIYTADGVLVRTLSGQTWDGKNESGNEVGSGTYIFLVKTGAGTTKGRVAVIR